VIAYLSRLAALFSQMINAIFLFGHHDMTVSARAYINRGGRVWGCVYRGINLLFFWQFDHCLHSFLADLEYSQEIQQIAEQEGLTSFYRKRIDF
jgi:hypothetical protein